MALPTSVTTVSKTMAAAATSPTAMGTTAPGTWSRLACLAHQNAATAGSAASISVAPVDRFTAAVFQPHIGSTFTLRDTDGALVLDAVVERGPAPSADLPAPFMLEFSGAVALEQRIHALAHAELGVVEIFLVRVGPQAYEAVFA